MDDTAASAVAIVGIGAVMPDAPDAAAFWNNIKSGRYSISDVPSGRWDPELFYDPDPHAPDKTYSKIGGWVTDFGWEPMRWKLPLPPKVSEQMDEGQRWSVACSRAALLDAGWPGWSTDPERVAVIFGNALGGEKHYATTMRVMFPEVARELRNAPSFAALPESVRESVIAETHKAYTGLSPEITEDTMPGELSNVIAGRVCSLFNFRGPNFVTDAACASTLAAMNAAIGGLLDHQYDVVLSGGVDRNNSVNGFIKFCKIGALSATGTRPFDAGADGFVMGEGAAVFVLKRLADAERDGDRIYAVLLCLRRVQRRQGQGHHRTESRRAAPRDRTRVAPVGSGPDGRRPHRGARDIHPGRRPATRPRRWKASSGRRGRPRAPSRSARSSPTSATSRPRRAPPGCSRPPWRCTRRCCRRA